MWVYTIFSVMMMVVMLSMSLSDQYTSLIIKQSQDDDKEVVIAFSEALEHYIQRVNPVPPADINALVSTSGFEYLKSINTERLGYASTSLVDGRLTFKRFVVFIQQPGTNATNAQYLTNNNCGTASFDVAPEFCGSTKSSWYVSDNRPVINQLVNNTVNQIDLMMQSFGHAFRLNGGFPDSTVAGVVIADNTSVALKQAVNFTLSASSCTGSFDFDGAPLQCHNLFNFAGNNIIYHRHAANFISIYTQLPFNDNTGAPLIYSRNFEI